ncbi:MAG: TonB-dependent receptor [Acidobacteriota bacterium]|nr:TonB-dependent receptor [Acidobacteriota bacterium]
MAEVVNVYESPPAIDPAKTAASETLDGQEIVNLPYPTPRDVRNALPFIPGVLRDATGQVHIGGSSSYQIYNQLDGFNVTHPTSGLLEMRVSADTLRAIEVQSSRYSAEHGKGSGGTVSLSTGMGDDRYRFSATNFIPSVQNRKGIKIDNWTPRATLSGPLRKKRAWFFLAADGEYGLDVIDELPPGADQNLAWRVNNLARAQVNLNQSNILTSSFLINHFRSMRAGLTRFNPTETTLDRRLAAYLFTAKDQSRLPNGVVLEVGFGASQFRADERPAGSAPYLIRPGGTSGNYFKTAEEQARRLQVILNLVLPTMLWHGRHEFKVGADVNRITYEQSAERRPISVFREDGTLSRQITFGGAPRFGRNNLEVSGFAQNRWTISERLLLETGIRIDWDQIIRRTSISPRLASTYLLTRGGETKISAGIGLYHDATNLAFITRPLAGRQVDLAYAPDGTTPAGRVETSFHVNERLLKSPRTLNWSVGLERNLPASVYLLVGLMHERGTAGFAFFDEYTDQPGQRIGQRIDQRANVFELRNDRRDHYTALEVTARRTFRGNYQLFASYVRSAARSTAVLDFDLDGPFFGRQGGGLLPWDAPNRLLSWGWLPLVKKFDFAYSLDWRSGYPFSLVNEDQELVGSPGSHRFPAYFSLNTHVERRFRLLGLQLALRAGFNNLTNRPNPTEVNNNVDSPLFLTFGGTDHRAFVGRVRFLGRK